MRAENKNDDISELSEILIIFLILVGLVLPMFGIVHLLYHSTAPRVLIGLGFTFVAACIIEKANRGVKNQILFALVVSGFAAMGGTLYFLWPEPVMNTLVVDRESFPAQAEALKIVESREVVRKE